MVTDTALSEVYTPSSRAIAGFFFFFFFLKSIKLSTTQRTRNKPKDLDFQRPLEFLTKDRNKAATLLVPQKPTDIDKGHT